MRRFQSAAGLVRQPGGLTRGEYVQVWVSVGACIGNGVGCCFLPCSLQPGTCWRMHVFDSCTSSRQYVVRCVLRLCGTQYLALQVVHSRYAPQTLMQIWWPPDSWRTVRWAPAKLRRHSAADAETGLRIVCTITFPFMNICFSSRFQPIRCLLSDHSQLNSCAHRKEASRQSQVHDRNSARNSSAGIWKCSIETCGCPDSMTTEEKQPAVFKKLGDLRPDTAGHNLTVKVGSNRKQPCAFICYLLHQLNGTVEPRRLIDQSLQLKIIWYLLPRPRRAAPHAFSRMPGSFRIVSDVLVLSCWGQFTIRHRWPRLTVSIQHQGAPAEQDSVPPQHAVVKTG